MSFFGKILKWIGVQTQLKEDLTKLVGVVVVHMNKAQNDHGEGNGAKKKEQALNDFFDSVEKEGGIDLPSWCTGGIARMVVGELIDFLAAVAKGEDDPGN